MAHLRPHRLFVAKLQWNLGPGTWSSGQGSYEDLYYCNGKNLSQENILKNWVFHILKRINQ